MVKSGMKASRPRGVVTRDMIIDVARQLFSEYGYHNTGIADIQAATALTKGAFYHHFRSKADVAMAVLDAAGADYERALMGPMAKLESAGEKLEACLDRIVELNERPDWCNCCLLATLMAELSAEDADLRLRVGKLRDGIVSSLAGLIEEGQSAGVVNGSVEGRLASEWIVNTVAGTVLARKLGDGDMVLERVMGAMKRFLLEGGRG